ncbi:MAG: FG-GAP repeat domain-containing protein, partial [Gammaproteobacteria bacterium]
MRCREERPLPFALLPAALLLCCAARAADLDGDGADDLVFRDLASDSKQLLVLAGGQARHIELAPPEDRWQGVEVRLGDFDGDRRSELLTRNLHTGATALRNAGTAPDHGVRPVDGLSPDPGQLIEAVADFDGDGRDDLLLRDRESARRGIYRMRGAAVDTAHSGTLDFASGPRQRFVAAGDFDGDGRADLLLRHETT